VTFEQFNELMLSYAPVLPLLGLPIYLLFALAGKGASRTAVYLSLSAPGLLIPVYYVWAEFAAERRVSPTLAFFSFILLLDPGVLAFPAVFVFQVANTIHGKWIAMTKRSGALAALLLFLYFWNYVAIGMLNSK
jgi:hypothetical protein